MLSAYELPAQRLVTCEFEIKRSRFITWLNRVSKEEDARAFVQQARDAYPDARHHCSAFIINVDGAQPILRSSDDGEPSGTAGRPMLEVLKGSGMHDVCAVVIRYFGGVKLGTGGLVSAYTNAVAAAVDQVERRRKTVAELAQVALPHRDAGRVEAELRNHGIEVVDVAYGSMATYTLAFAPGERSRVDAAVAAATQGSATTKSAGHRWVESAA